VRLHSLFALLWTALVQVNISCWEWQYLYLYLVVSSLCVFTSHKYVPTAPVFQLLGYDPSYMM